MKLFKKALVATAIVGAFGANAATVTDAVNVHSKQGLEVNGPSAVAGDNSVRVIVREQLEAGDLITLTFGEAIDFTGAVIGDVDTDPGTAVGATDFEIVYGSGTYTMTATAIDTTDRTITLEIDTGDPVTKDSSFEIVVNNRILAVGAASSDADDATVTYSAASGIDGSAKDVGPDDTGKFVRVADQFSAVVKQELDGIIERVNQVTFIENGEDAAQAASTTKDTLVVDVTDNAADQLSPIGAGATFTLTLTGNFKDFVPGEIVATSAGDDTFAATTFNADMTEATIVGTSVTATIDDFTVELTKQAAANSVLPVTDFEADLDIDFGGADDFIALSNANAGEWILDATIVNIPYFPVGFEGLDTSVHFANEKSADADVIITAIDDAGKEYSSAGSTITLAGDTVTKYRQDQIQAWLKDEDGNPVADKTKLSVTFNIDADDGDVNAYAFSNAKAAGARQSLVTSQQKGK